MCARYASFLPAAGVGLAVPQVNPIPNIRLEYGTDARRDSCSPSSEKPVSAVST
jgi:hypothetical protein